MAGKVGLNMTTLVIIAEVVDIPAVEAERTHAGATHRRKRRVPTYRGGRTLAK
jgi:hypothetical protein